MSNLLNNWQEVARQKVASTVVDKDALEKAFMDQSYGFVANKAGDLFKDPYRLGFEVVFKNDAMTRMVGLYAFRLGKRLLYAPVFFLNGQIKGHDLLYRHWIKKFCPSNREWVQFLIESSVNAIGKPISRQEAGKLRNAVNFSAIAGPPNYKAAAVAAEWEALLDEMSEQHGLPGPVLQDFLLKHGHGGALEKLASLIDRSSLFADALVRLPEETWNPPVEKFACPKVARTLPCLEVHDNPPSDMTEKEAAAFYRDGYLLRDKLAGSSERLTRLRERRGECPECGKPNQEGLKCDCPETKQASQVVAEDVPVMDVATGLAGPGRYKVLMPGGEWRTMIAAYEATSDLGSSNRGCCCPVDYDRGRQQQRPVVLVDEQSGDSTTIWDPRQLVVDDNLVDDDAALSDLSEVGKDKPTASKAWRVLVGGAFSRPFYCLSVKDVDGVSVCQIGFHSTKGEPSMTLRINPDAPESSLSEGFVNNQARFVSVSHKVENGYVNYPSKLAQPGSIKDFDRWVMAHEGLAKKASISHDPVIGMWKLEVDGGWTEDTRQEIHLKLASMGLEAERAGEILDDVRDQRRPYRCWIIKKAFPTRQAERENFYDSHDPDFGVELEGPQQQTLRTETQRIRNAQPAVGDALDPAQGAGPSRRTADPIPQDLMLSSTPEQLDQIAKTQKLPNVFEHGAIGSLIKTYDSLAMIETYIPVFDDAIDKLGRTLFLFYFKPSDFEKAYGTDDMQTQENDFLNAFKVMGDLTLDLLKRHQAVSGSDVLDTGTSVQMLE